MWDLRASEAGAQCVHDHGGVNGQLAPHVGVDASWAGGVGGRLGKGVEFGPRQVSYFFLLFFYFSFVFFSIFNHFQI